MRVLGIGDCIELGSLYLALEREGHDVRVFMGDPSHAGTFEGLLTPLPARTSEDWRAQLDWVGRDGVVLFETVGQGSVQDGLRRDGFRVIGGSEFGDRLELDRAFGQQRLREAGLAIAPSHSFASAAEARDWLARHPGRYVLKSDDPAIPTRVGESADGADIDFHLAHHDGGRVLLMPRLDGVEVGVGAFFDGHRFVRPACLDFEHKRFFPGDIGEMTGEMGTLARFEQPNRLFDATLAKLESDFAAARHVGWINLNLIVNGDGVWPLEFTCRFGYPGTFVLAPLQRIEWGDLLDRIADGSCAQFDTASDWSVGIVLTIPPFPHGHASEESGADPPIVVVSPVSARKLHWVDVRQSKERLFARRRTGYVAVVTGVGATIEVAREEALELARSIVVPDLRYRIDIGATGDAKVRRLRALGW